MGEHIAISCAQGLAQANFFGALGHRNQHDVDDANRPQRQGHNAHSAEEEVHHVENLSYQLLVFNGVPLLEGVFVMPVKAVPLGDDLVHLLLGNIVQLGRDRLIVEE